MGALWGLGGLVTCDHFFALVRSQQSGRDLACSYPFPFPPPPPPPQPATDRAPGSRPVPDVPAPPRTYLVPSKVPSKVPSTYLRVKFLKFQPWKLAAANLCPKIIFPQLSRSRVTSHSISLTTHLPCHSRSPLVPVPMGWKRQMPMRPEYLHTIIN